DQEEPQIAAAAAGGFVIVWRSRSTNPQTPYDVYAQRFAPDGTRLGSEMALTAAASGDQNHPTIAMKDSGEFVVAWGDIEVFNPPFRTRIRGQRFDGQGNTLGAEFTVSSYATGFHANPA